MKCNVIHFSSPYKIAFYIEIDFSTERRWEWATMKMRITNKITKMCGFYTCRPTLMQGWFTIQNQENRLHWIRHYSVTWIGVVYRIIIDLFKIWHWNNLLHHNTWIADYALCLDMWTSYEFCNICSNNSIKI